MKLPDLRSALNQRPFTPLLLHISGGRTIEVRHPELCVPGISSAFFGFPASEDTGATAYARYVIVDLDHIISLEPLNAWRRRVTASDPIKRGNVHMKRTPETRAKKGSVASRIIAGLEEFAEALENNGRISDQFTCRKVVLNLQPKAYGPDDVRKARSALGVSQALFPQFLGVSPKTVRSWEQGTNIPKDMACRFMDEIQRDPKYWRRRLLESLTAK